DDAPAVGICGSGLIDLLGELFVTGLLDKSGHLDREAPTPRVRVRDNVPEYVVAWAGEGGAVNDIALTESDISGLIRAKAAIYAGFEVLCRSVGVDLADVEQIFIGGAFGQYINIEKAIRIGLLPDQPVERFHFLGNTSAQGAYAMLLCVSSRHDVLELAAKMTYLELSADNTFMDEYMSALFLPHTHLEDFPTVCETLARRGTDAAPRASTEIGG
ncbi:MAG: ATP-binding protein, partial [Thermoleophilia bacterium]